MAGEHRDRAGQLQRVEISIQSQPLRAGWALIRALLEHRGTGLEARLVTQDTQGTHQRLSLPVTLKGSLLELVYLPAGIQHVWLELTSPDPVQCNGQVVMDPVSRLTSRLLMWRRIAFTLLRASPRQRRALGLSWTTMLIHPHMAYLQVGKHRHFVPSPSYPDWIAQCEQFTTADRRRLKRAIKRLGRRRCHVDVVIDARTHGSPEDIRCSLSSLARQLEIPYRPWILVPEHGYPAPDEWLQDQQHLLNLAIQPGPWDLEDSQWVFIMPPGTELAPWALAWMAMKTVSDTTQVIYADHDYLVNGKRADPQFKPDWSEELARTSHYTGDVFALRSALFRRVYRQSGFDSAYQLILDAARLAGAAGICHIPAILCHLRHRPPAASANPQVLQNHLQHNGVNAEVETTGIHLRVRYRLPKSLPKVSIVIPTRDALCYLKPCVDSILNKTTWPDFELLVVDNQSQEPETHRYLERLKDDPRVRLLRYDKPFNYSAINNHAVNQARGELVCLLNNDTEVISGDWLEEMVSRVLQPGIGVVGARLYFGDGRVQHAGDVLGPGGCASHLHGILEADDPGYMHRALLAQDLSAVTAACLVTHKTLYQQLGGLDEINLPVAFNDVDYCLRVREAGQRVIYTPYAELYHHESVSRGSEDSPEKVARAKRESDYIRSRWGHIIDRDPFYNPNLNYAQPDFKLGKVPRVGWPW